MKSSRYLMGGMVAALLITASAVMAVPTAPPTEHFDYPTASASAESMGVDPMVTMMAVPDHDAPAALAAKPPRTQPASHAAPVHSMSGARVALVELLAAVAVVGALGLAYTRFVRTPAPPARPDWAPLFGVMAPRRDAVASGLSPALDGYRVPS